MTHQLRTVLRRQKVQEVTGLACSTIYKMMSRGKFPRPIRIAEKSVGWLETDIAEWQRQCVAVRDGAKAA